MATAFVGGGGGGGVPVTAVRPPAAWPAATAAVTRVPPLVPPPPVAVAAAAATARPPAGLARGHRGIAAAAAVAAAAAAVPATFAATPATAAAAVAATGAAGAGAAADPRAAAGAATAPGCLFDGATVSSPQNRGGGARIAVVWLHPGCLRLHDNAALVAAAALGPGWTVLPLATVPSGRGRAGGGGRGGPAVSAAVADLRRSLHARGSDLVLWPVGGVGVEGGGGRGGGGRAAAAAAVDAACTTVGAEVLIAFGPPPKGGGMAAVAAASTYRTVWVSASAVGAPPLPPPSVLPPMPPMAAALLAGLPGGEEGALWVVGAPAGDGHGADAGETAARRRLAVHVARAWPAVAATAAIAPVVVMRHFGRELAVGSLSACSIVAACRSRGGIVRQAAGGVSRWAHAIAGGSGGLAPRGSAALALGSMSPGAVALSGIAAYELRGGSRKRLVWDDSDGIGRFVLQDKTRPEGPSGELFGTHGAAADVRASVVSFFSHAFFPEDVTPDYYSFTAWRFFQRCISATVGVFGTQALLLALGIKSGRLGQAAAISWVLKDGLGRVGKMLWAGSVGRDFDVDPRRWRFRSALMYAAGNGLEIVTQIFPASFLVVATWANTLKQVSMLTASATRNAMYRSFGGKAQNIADITAKGEAQIVVADLIGMTCGIQLSKALGAGQQGNINVFIAYVVLSAVDVLAIYQELRQVVFRTINPERLGMTVAAYVQSGTVPPPPVVSRMEPIFLPPVYDHRQIFVPLSRLAATPAELTRTLRAFRGEKYAIHCVRDGSGKARKSGLTCKVALREDATNMDVLRSMLAVGYASFVPVANGGEGAADGATLASGTMPPRSAAAADAPGAAVIQPPRPFFGHALRLWRRRPAPANGCVHARVVAANQRASRTAGEFLLALKASGWDVDHLLLRTIKRRASW
ncbi:hypothetical protein MMPV_004944 [Pyropia vietnamensis]